MFFQNIFAIEFNSKVVGCGSTLHSVAISPNPSCNVNSVQCTVYSVHTTLLIFLQIPRAPLNLRPRCNQYFFQPIIYSWFSANFHSSFSFSSFSIGSQHAFQRSCIAGVSIYGIGDATMSSICNDDTPSE